MFFLSLTRTSIIGVLFIQQKNVGDENVLQGLEPAISVLLIVYLMLIYIGVTVALLFFFV